MSAGDKDDSGKLGNGTGSPALEGWEYQVDVSVWLALDLVLGSNLTSELVLEPASQEDIEADLKEDDVPGRLTSSAQVNGHRLIVQAKMRTGDAWTPSSIRKLLLHGKDRPSAASRLSAPDTYYLLVTSGGLNGDTRKFGVRQPWPWPKRKKTPKLIGDVLKAGAADRFAIAGNKDEEKIRSEIRRLLTERFRVPNARWEDCHKALRDQARMRMRKAGKGRWRRVELEETIRQFDGYLADSPQLEHYVHPTNWDDLRNAMKTNHAALIVGQSGTGKTMATGKLFEELSKEIPGLSYVIIAGGPNELYADRTRPPVLYDIQDPWGKFAFDPDNRPWNEELTRAFSNASHDRMYVATSRRDVAEDGKALERVKRWVVNLDPKHYGKEQQSRLYQTRIRNLPRDLQSLAEGAERKVLKKLRTPYEIQKFFDALPTVDRATIKNPDRFVDIAIDQAHSDSIETTVVDQIEERKDDRAAVVIWALMKSGGGISRSVIREIEDDLVEAEPRLDQGVSPLIDFQVAARNLRQVGNVVSYYHPRVEAGIEKAIAGHALNARRMLARLIDILAARDSSGSSWGAEMSARILSATKRKLPALMPKVSTGVQARIDLWLKDELLRPGSDLDSALKLAEDAGSPASTVSELARWLVRRPHRNFEQWRVWDPPKTDEAWKDRMRADPATHALAGRFVRQYLLRAHADYPPQLVTLLQEFAGDLTDAFLDAARGSIGWGYFTTAETIAEGALQNLDRCDPIVDEAIRVLTPSANELRERAGTRLAIVNGEYSDDYAEYLSQDDSGTTASDFLQAYVNRLRLERGWRDVAGHRRLPDLLGYWLSSVAGARGAQVADEIEVLAALHAGFGTDEEDRIWRTATRLWRPSYRRWALDRLRGGGTSSARVAALACLLEVEPHEVAKLCNELVAEGNTLRLLEIALELNQTRDLRDDDGKRSATLVLTGSNALPAAFAELAAFDRDIEDKQTPSPLSQPAIEALQGVTGKSEPTCRFKVIVDGHTNLQIDDDIRWLLATTDDSAIAVEAIEAAIRRGLTAEIQEALTHKFARVVAQALNYVATPLAAPLPASLLAYARAKGSSVRRSLAKLLVLKPHEDHVAAMLVLSKDDWTSSWRSHNERADFDIAVLAIKAFDNLGQVTRSACDELLAMAMDTADGGLSHATFVMLARHGDETTRGRLFDIATGNGKRNVRIDAASALVMNYELVEPAIAQLPPGFLAKGTERVLSRLLLVLTLRAPSSVVIATANDLAVMSSRRVMLLPMLNAASERGDALVNALAALLPSSHPALSWAIERDRILADADLADLGSPASVAEVLDILNPTD